MLYKQECKRSITLFAAPGMSSVILEDFLTALIIFWNQYDDYDYDDYDEYNENDDDYDDYDGPCDYDPYYY